ncbi:MAG: hypothetical protein Q4Q06_03430, partial [Bacteroidota bacterium]|nr:hypothetical protein [Bacteroidota bacterium]
MNRKRIVFLVFSLLALCLNAQEFRMGDNILHNLGKMLRLPFSQKEALEMSPHYIFFYNACLTNGEGIVAGDFDLGFETDTYKILEANGFLDSIFVRDNEKQMARIDSMTWTYSCEFSVNKQQLRKDFAFLNVENIDGNATLYLNNKKVREYHNSFMTYNDNIKQYLRKGKNQLSLVFVPKDSIRVKQRSPQYLYGWDWHPKTLAPRIGAIYLSFEDNKPILDYKSLQTKSLTVDYSKAIMEFRLKFRFPLKEEHSLDLEFEGEKHNFVLQPNKEGAYTFYLSLDAPKLWWPNGEGEQYLYNGKISLDGDSCSEISFGVRTIELVREKDLIPNLEKKEGEDDFIRGESFYFKINGRAVFCKGANYITGPVTPKEDILLAHQANMNMLRIWGGANYGDEEFYNLCDKYGIMVWQDFPFACELYPADSVFLENVRQEASQNVQRIVSHPSLALFCGNNEIWEGWHNWGWKQMVKDTILAVKEYDTLFRSLLPRVVQEYAVGIDYIHSSPMEYGWGHRESRQIGDCHYWGVWWGDSVFETYTRKIPRFMSEYGFQSAMNQNTALEYCSMPYNKDNEGFAIHQKHDRGFQLIDSRLKQWFGDNVKTSEDYINYTQLLGQEAMKLTIETHRRAKPYCMGTLFWQYNELYPCVGWGCIDYSGEAKPTYYTAMLSYQPIIFVIDKYTSEDSIFVYVCSDRNEDIQMEYTLKILDDKDQIHYKYIEDIAKVKANESKKIASIAYKDIKDFDKTTCYLWIEGMCENMFINNYAFFSYPKDYISLQKYLD